MTEKIEMHTKGFVQMVYLSSVCGIEASHKGVDFTVSNAFLMYGIQWSDFSVSVVDASLSEGEQRNTYSNGNHM